MSIGVAVMSEGEETTSQRRGGAGGNQTDHGKETVAGTDIEIERHLPPSKLRGSSTMSGAGKTDSGAKKTRSRTSDKGATKQMTPLLRKRSPTLNCRER